MPRMGTWSPNNQQSLVFEKLRCPLIVTILVNKLPRDNILRLKTPQICTCVYVIKIQASLFQNSCLWNPCATYLLLSPRVSRAANNKRPSLWMTLFGKAVKWYDSVLRSSALQVVFWCDSTGCQEWDLPLSWPHTLLSLFLPLAVWRETRCTL